MSDSKMILPVGLGLLLLAGCAPVQKYRPAPISPVSTSSSPQTRSLNDPALKQFAEGNLGREIDPWPPKTWDLRLLTEAAFYFSPTLDAARARAAAA